MQADFGLDADLEPKLVEIQGFPTLYAYQPMMAAAYREAYGIDESLAALPDGLTLDEYNALMRRAIVAGHDPENVVLLEIDPWNQKTRARFRADRAAWGVRTVDIAEVRKEGRKLFYHRGGRTIPIERIYNRVIVDELVRRGVRMPFDFRDELDVEWAGHPNWFFRLSKFSLPYLDHPAVPRTQFLDRVESRRTSRAVCPEAALLLRGNRRDRRPNCGADRRRARTEARRLHSAGARRFPAGGRDAIRADKIEVRIMYLWLDRLRPMNTIIRMGRGAQMGVDHNKGMEWVGGSAAFIDTAG